MPPALLLLLCSAAHAFDVLKTEDLLHRIDEVSARAGGPIVVAAAGGNTEATLRRMLRLHPEAPCTLERVPLMGEPQQDMSRLLERKGEHCGLRVSPGGTEGEWLVSEHGDCGGSARPEEVGWIPTESASTETPLAVTVGEGSATSTSASVPPPRPVGSPDPARLLLLEASLPDPTTALLSSVFVGFGSGHFYARDNRGGWLFAGLQAGGLAVYGLSRFAGAQSFTASGEQAARVFGTLGLTLTVGSRLVEAGTAPGAAHVAAQRQIERELP